MEFKEIDPIEVSRTYGFPNEEMITIDGAYELAVSDSGKHYINSIDEDGNELKWIVNTGWLAICIDVEEWSF